MLSTLDSRGWYSVLVGAVAIERLFEAWLSRRNGARARALGAVEYGAGHYPLMVALHAAFLVACVLEPWILGRPLRPALAAVALALVGGAMALRYWAVVSLGERWNTRVLVLPGAPAVVSGPYRFLRHPNYLAVIVELAALPMVHGGWATALVFSAANAALLAVRIGVEERALSQHCDYQRLLVDRAEGAAIGGA